MSTKVQPISLKHLGSVITNCYLINRETDTEPMFTENTTFDGSLFINLNGYVIVPIEKYEASLEAVKEFAKEVSQRVPEALIVSPRPSKKDV